MTEQTTTRPAYLAGHLAPVADEVEALNLPITGSLPPALNGRYFRNGPNPLPGENPGHWFAGHGMIHGIRLREGRAEWYRNRWVRTPRLAGAHWLDANGKRDFSVHTANTHIIEHAGKLLALGEGGFPYEMSPELETLGACDFNGRLTSAMTAHPKEDPRTGELHFFGYSVMPPFVTYHRLSPAGELELSVPIEMPAATMMHDFAITEHHVVWMDLPLAFDAGLVGKGVPFQWNDNHGARLGVMPKDDPGRVRWFDIDPCYVFHVGNAREDAAGRIVLDAVRYQPADFIASWAGFADRATNPAGPAASVGEESRTRLHRWTLDPATGGVLEEVVDDMSIEFPTLNESRTGLPHRYLYSKRLGDLGGVVKFDLATGARQIHDLGPDIDAGEPVFAPGGDSGEDAGWLLAITTNRAGTASELIVLDATDIDGPPVARIGLPRGVPAGFHGSWIPDA